MRKRHWFTKLLSGALGTVLPVLGWAQAPDAGYVPYIDPNTPQAAVMGPDYGGMPAGWPPGAAQWPYISPHYGPAVDEHSYQDGFWYNRQQNDGRKYFTFLGATLNRYAQPGRAMIGDDQAPGFFVPGTGTGTGTGAATGGLRAVHTPRRWSDLEDRISGGGFRGMAGWFNANDTGVYLDGFWAEEGTAGYLAFDPLIDLSNPAEIERRAEDVLFASVGIPLFDGGAATELPLVPPQTTPIIIPGGGTQPYDLYYKLGWQSQSYGAGVGYYSNPMLESGSFKLRPMVGMRYLQIRENATFRGADSGLDYVINTQTFRPVAGSVTGDVNIFESAMRSSTESHLGGPEIGFRFDLGDEKFKVWFQSKLGVLANHSTRHINGFGIGRGFGDPDGTEPLTPSNPNLTQFSQQEKTTSVSPTFEQTIMMRAPLLQFVPGVRKLRLFEEAQFQLGYTWLVAGNVHRPGDSIDWRGFPNYPTINNNSSTFYVTSWNIGVEWTY